MCTESQVHAIMKSIYDKAVAEFGDKLDAVILYGSYARGDYDEESDMDVMVRVKLTQAELKKHQWEMSVFCSRLGLAENIVISLNLQDFETFEQYKDVLPFYRNVMRDGVKIGA